MHKRTIHFIAAAITAFTASGCATWSTSNIDGAASSGQPVSEQPITPSLIRLSENDFPGRKYTPLGDISVTVNKTTIFHPDPTPALVNEKLREEAAKLGANAVIYVRYGQQGISAFSWGSLNGKGRAIRFTD